VFPDLVPPRPPEPEQEEPEEEEEEELSPAERERRRVLDELRSRFPSYFNDLDRYLKERGHVGIRVQRAYLNLVEPLLQGDETGGIERDWSELTDDEQIEFIKAGIKREKILLNRSPDIPRAQEAAQRNPRRPRADA
jgi:hypothetical protein